MKPIHAPSCDRCQRPATVHEIDGSMYCDRHEAENVRLRHGGTGTVTYDPKEPEAKEADRNAEPA